MTVTPQEYTGPQDFVPLHCHTVFSALDGVASPEDYAEACSKRGCVGMAVTEHGHMASVPDMHFSFKKRGLRYIAGCEIYYNDFELWRQEQQTLGQSSKAIKEADEELGKRVARNRHLTVLAKNDVGFHNLILLTTLAHQFGSFQGKPRIWFEKLCEHREGLIVLSGCVNGPPSHELRLDIGSLKSTGKRYERRHPRELTAAQYVKNFKEVFGDDFFVEVQFPCLPELYDVHVFRGLLDMADRYGVKAVLTGDSHYIKQEDAFLQRVMMAVDQGTSVFDPMLFQMSSDQQWFKTRAELWATFHNNGYSAGVSNSTFHQICDNTLLVLDKCSKISPDTSPKIPDWSDIEPGKDAATELRRLTVEELQRRGLDKITKKWPVDGHLVTYAEQVEIELERFIDKGFASYFLITADLLRFGKSKGWPFGPRGSAGGSLVCFLLGIHSIDPLVWGLSFDRFMASSRGGFMLKVSM